MVDNHCAFAFYFYILRSLSFALHAAVASVSPAQWETVRTAKSMAVVILSIR